MDSVDSREGSLQQRSHVNPIRCSVLIAISKHPASRISRSEQGSASSIWWHTQSLVPESIRIPGEPRASLLSRAERCSHMWPGAEAAQSSDEKQALAGSPAEHPLCAHVGKGSSGGPRSRAVSPRCDSTRNVCKHHPAEVGCLLIAFKGRRDRLWVLAGSNR